MIYECITNLCADSDQQFGLMLQYYSILKTKPLILSDKIDEICIKWEIVDNIVPTLLKAKIQKLVNPDGFKLLKETMMELEEMSNGPIPENSEIDYSKIIAKTKCMIFGQMIQV